MYSFAGGQRSSASQNRGWVLIWWKLAEFQAKQKIKLIYKSWEYRPANEFWIFWMKSPVQPWPGSNYGAFLASERHGYLSGVLQIVGQFANTALNFPLRIRSQEANYDHFGCLERNRRIIVELERTSRVIESTPCGLFFKISNDGDPTTSLGRSVFPT